MLSTTRIVPDNPNQRTCSFLASWSKFSFSILQTTT